MNEKLIVTTDVYMTLLNAALSKKEEYEEMLESVRGWDEPFKDDMAKSLETDINRLDEAMEVVRKLWMCG